MTRRTRIVVGVGDVLQLLGATGACLAVAHLAGLWWGVLLAALFVFVEANLTYANRTVGLSLPSGQDRIVAAHRLLTPARVLRRLVSAAARKVRRS